MRTGFQDAGFPLKGQASDSCCGRRCAPQRTDGFADACWQRLLGSSFHWPSGFGVLLCETNWLYSDFFSRSFQKCRF